MTAEIDTLCKTFSIVAQRHRNIAQRYFTFAQQIFHRAAISLAAGEFHWAT